MNEVKQFLSHILERRKLIKVTNKRENLLEREKNQHKLRIKGIHNKDVLKRNKKHCK